MKYTLLWQEMRSGDVDLLFDCVARQIYDLHSIKEGPVDGLQVVASAEEQNFGQIEGCVHVMILEGVILFRIQQFQHGTGGVEHGVPCELVDLVEKDHWIVHLQRRQSLHDGTRHAADVCTPMTSKFCLVSNASQSNAVELPSQGLGHGSAKRGLSNSWRSMEAKDWPLHVSAHLLHGKEFQDASLHLLEPVMVLFQDLVRSAKLEVILGALSPRKACECLEVRAAHRVLRMVWLDVLQPPQFSLCDLLSLCTKLCFLECLPECRDVILFLLLFLLFRLGRLFPFLSITLCFGTGTITRLARPNLPHLTLQICKLPLKHRLSELVLCALLHL
mmetsp:Transcript_68222/g.120415  ORF Transcript_68222/g.120415 Transcript_68222/m.120415 type:complete len:332 (+) Transcript_68222:1274-2269(+)